MRSPLLAGIAFLGIPTAFAQVSEAVTAEYLRGLADFLNQNQFSSFVEIFHQASRYDGGQSYIEALTSNQDFTIFAMHDVPENETATILQPAPQVIWQTMAGHVNVSEVANSTHTLAYTLLNADWFSYPIQDSHPSRMVIVLERPPTTGNNVTHISNGRGWVSNTTADPILQYRNLWFQPVNSYFGNVSYQGNNSRGLTNYTDPSFFQTNIAVELNLTSPQSAKQFSLDFSNNIPDLDFRYCMNCTVLAPIDSNTPITNRVVDRNVLLNQVINGSTFYSPAFRTANQTAITAAGESMTLWTNTTGQYVQLDGKVARIVRSDIMATRGVIHLVDVAFSDSSHTNATQPPTTTTGLPPGFVGTEILLEFPTSSIDFNSVTASPTSTSSPTPTGGKGGAASSVPGVPWSGVLLTVAVASIGLIGTLA